MLAANIMVPTCLYCVKLLLHQRYQWLSNRALATRANVVDNHDASQRATDQVGGSGLGAWGLDDQQVASLASERGRAHQLANHSRVMASSSRGVLPGLVPTRLGNDRRALPTKQYSTWLSWF